MKKTALVICLLALLLTGCACAEDRLTVVLATDMHYLSPSLTDGGEGFMDIVYAADGKVIHYSPQICRAFVRDMLRLKPDAVILSGDLTLNGAPESLREFADMLEPLRAAGIRVLAMPGNHDVGGKAYAFRGSGVISFPAATAEGFLQIYEGFGPADALSRDEGTLSYTARLSDRVWALMVDVNTVAPQGTVRDDTFAWIEGQLQAARAAGATVIGVSHQNLLPHNKYFTQGVMISQARRLQALYRQYGVRLNLSGHTHMQHIAADGDIVEIVTSSMALAPGYYGVITLDGGALDAYTAVPVDVSGWAAEAGETNADLLGFADYTKAFYCEVVRRKAADGVADLSADQDEKTRMLDFAVDLSYCDFSGTRSNVRDPEALALWEKYQPYSAFTYYLKGAVSDGLKDMTRYSFAE